MELRSRIITTRLRGKGESERQSGSQVWRLASTPLARAIEPSEAQEAGHVEGRTAWRMVPVKTQVGRLDPAGRGRSRKRTLAEVEPSRGPVTPCMWLRPQQVDPPASRCRGCGWAEAPRLPRRRRRPPPRRCVPGRRPAPGRTPRRRAKEDALASGQVAGRRIGLRSARAMGPAGRSRARPKRERPRRPRRSCNARTSGPLEIDPAPPAGVRWDDVTPGGDDGPGEAHEPQAELRVDPAPPVIRMHSETRQTGRSQGIVNKVDSSRPGPGRRGPIRDEPRRRGLGPLRPGQLAALEHQEAVLDVDQRFEPEIVLGLDPQP